MSNFTKSFNFRNGVQVDDDNFVISPTGLVGIGTTQPKKSLDVFGDTRVSGMASLNNVDIVGILTVGNNITIDATTGIISATSFDGSVSGAGGIVAIATDGFIQNVGALTTDAKVGIKTDNPEFSLQVGSNPVSSIGVGITDGDIFVSGLTTTRNLFTSGISTFVGFTTQTSKLFQIWQCLVKFLQLTNSYKFLQILTNSYKQTLSMSSCVYCLKFSMV